MATQEMILHLGTIAKSGTKAFMEAEGVGLPLPTPAVWGSGGGLGPSALVVALRTEDPEHGPGSLLGRRHVHDRLLAQKPGLKFGSSEVLMAACQACNAGAKPRRRRPISIVYFISVMLLSWPVLEDRV